jgi:hypothetical protein
MRPGESIHMHISYHSIFDLSTLHDVTDWRKGHNIWPVLES